MRIRPRFRGLDALLDRLGLEPVPLRLDAPPGPPPSRAPRRAEPAPTPPPRDPPPGPASGAADDDTEHRR